MNFSKYENDFVNACLSGDLDTVKSLLYDHEDDNLRNNNVEMAIEAGCLGGHMNIVDFSISKGAIDRYNGFYDACEGGHEHIVKFMILKCEVNLDKGLGGACCGGNMNLVKYLISKGANNWELGFLNACIGGHIDIANLMIEKGANNFEDGFYYACVYNNINIVNFMIEKDNGLDWYKGFIRVCRNGYIDIVRLIVSRFNRNDMYLEKGLIEACINGRIDVVEYLISKGVDGSNEKCAHGHKNIVKLFNRMSIAKNIRFSYSNVKNAFEMDIKMLSEIVNKDLIWYIVIYI